MLQPRQMTMFASVQKNRVVLALSRESQFGDSKYSLTTEHNNSVAALHVHTTGNTVQRPRTVKEELTNAKAALVIVIARSKVNVEVATKKQRITEGSSSSSCPCEPENNNRARRMNWMTVTMPPTIREK